MESLFHVGEKVIVKNDGALPKISVVIDVSEGVFSIYPIKVGKLNNHVPFSESGLRNHSDTAPSLFKLTKENVDAMNTLYGTNLKAPMTPKDIAMKLLEEQKFLLCFDKYESVVVIICYSGIEGKFVCSNGKYWDDITPIDPRTGKEITEQDLES